MPRSPVTTQVTLTESVYPVGIAQKVQPYATFPPLGEEVGGEEACPSKTGSPRPPSINLQTLVAAVLKCIPYTSCQPNVT